MSIATVCIACRPSVVRAGLGLGLGLGVDILVAQQPLALQRAVPLEARVLLMHVAAVHHHGQGLDLAWLGLGFGLRLGLGVGLRLGLGLGLGLWLGLGLDVLILPWQGSAPKLSPLTGRQQCDCPRHALSTTWSGPG